MINKITPTASETLHMISVYCTADIPIETINDFLERASGTSPEDYQFRLITTKDVGSLKEPSFPPTPPFESPFLGVYSGLCGGYVAQYTSFNPCLSQKAFVYLDKQTAKDGNTCNIVGAEDGSLRVTFDYSKVVAKHFIHETRTWLQLQNDAAVAGGALDGNIVSDEEVLTETGKLLADELQAEDSMNWRQRRSSSEDLFIPLFCTADVPLEVLNDFLFSTYNEHRSVVPENCRLPGFMHLVTEWSSFSRLSPTKPPVITSSTRSPFISFSAETLSIFTKTKCGGDSSLGNSTFIILDKYTASGSKTCIVAVNNYTMEPGYQLLRCDFKNALSIAYIGDDGYGPAFQEYCESAAQNCDGVYHT